MKEKKYFHDKWFARILLLLENKKINSAFLELENYLESFPYDTYARTTYASLLIGRGRIEEAEEILNNTIITSRTTAKNIYELLKTRIKLLCCQRKYEECYQLFLENDLVLNEYLESYYSLLAFLRTRLNLPVDIDECFQSYTVKQIISYSEQRAINHIKKHVDDFDFKDGSCFCSDFPVEEVYYKLRNILPIKTEYDLYCGAFKNIYLFKYDGNGREFRKTVDYIKVVCIQDTNDIITMYPYKNKPNLPALDLDLGIKMQEEPSKVKRMSQIDKFNQRYGK